MTLCDFISLRSKALSITFKKTQIQEYLPPVQRSGVDAAFGHAKPGGHAEQFKLAPGREYIPVGQGTIGWLKCKTKSFDKQFLLADVLRKL